MANDLNDVVVVIVPFSRTFYLFILFAQLLTFGGTNVIQFNNFSIVILQFLLRLQFLAVVV